VVYGGDWFFGVDFGRYSNCGLPGVSGVLLIEIFTQLAQSNHLLLNANQTDELTREPELFPRFRNLPPGLKVYETCTSRFFRPDPEAMYSLIWP